MSRFVLSIAVVLALWMSAPVAHAADRSFELAFASGKSYAVASNAVVRGDRDYYSFGASGGQQITLAITSLEDNAVFQLWYKAGADWLPVDMPPDSRAWYGELPDSDGGRYRIEVGGTRGNATYDLFVGIAAAG
jgi:hypothetical protein